MNEESGAETPGKVIPAGELEPSVPAPVTDVPAGPAPPAAPEPSPPAPASAASQLAPTPAPARIGPPASAATRAPAAAPPDRGKGLRPELSELREPLYREAGGYTLRMDPQDLAKLRELPGSREKTERELGELFFDSQAARLTEAIAGDVATPAEVRVVVDPYSRQAFLAVGKTIRGIVSF